MRASVFYCRNNERKGKTSVPQKIDNCPLSIVNSKNNCQLSTVNCQLNFLPHFFSTFLGIAVEKSGNL